jgi:hypothetical protein
MRQGCEATLLHLQIRFVRGALATPQLLTDVDIPESISLLGQTVDLQNIRDALAPARRGLQSAVSQAPFDSDLLRLQSC